MLSRTSEYALQAMTYLVRHVEDFPIVGRRIAEETEIPAKYLSAILGNLVRVGILESSPGLGGGFRLSRSPKEISLADVCTPFEPAAQKHRKCPFGNTECSDDDPCGGHKDWKRVQETFALFLQKTSILDVSVKQSGRRVGKRKRS